jgi:hypothetical protein
MFQITRSTFVADTFTYNIFQSRHRSVILMEEIHFPSAHSKNDEIYRTLAPTRNKHALFDFLQVLLQRMESEKNLLWSHAYDIV